MSTAINKHPTLVDSVLEGGDDVAERSMDDEAASLRIHGTGSDSDDGQAWNNVSLDTPDGYYNEAGSSCAMCRICHEGDQDEPLVSPCSSSGTMGFVHVSCLEHWFNEHNVNFCELCGQRFQMAAQPSIAIRFLHWISYNVRSRVTSVVWSRLTTGIVNVFALILQVVMSESSQGDGRFMTSHRPCAHELYLPRP
ncbi:hypothetical protein HPB50_001795 [Hyalomma asiaticum]|uniref:Uncharacterized protein n=1 Tax=Hyalomma asiaticum TaxID=266040 RepID=A0ACB7SDH0_HYAAI|nr:hypothetical protein HPB50_001795 [Hyalomma asiaticum]